jgi:phosphoglycolate phosphatase
MKYPYILFDLDGTITDPYEGMTKSIQLALERYDIHESRESLARFIGPPLHLSFQRYYGFSKEQAMEAMQVYRGYYKKQGMFECRVYDGVESMLRKLQDAGATLALASSKPTVFATQILDHFSLLPYFSFISGSNLDGSMSDKAEVIGAAMQQYPAIPKKQWIMIGDREFDAEGARFNGIKCIGILHGYGSREELERAGALFIVEHPEEIPDLVL